MKPEEVVLQGIYNKEEEEFLRKKIAEYYIIYPKEIETYDYHKLINYDERCAKIRDMYEKNQKV